MSTLTAPASSVASSRALHYGLWAVQILLALAFLMAGGMKATAPLDELAKNMSFVSHVPGALVRFIGISEVLGAVGLVLPAATRIQPWLTPLAGALLAVVMVLAMGTHLSLGEPEALPANLVLGGLAAFVAVGRGWLAPIASR